MIEINYPYIPPNKTIHYVALDNKFMFLAKEFAREYSLDERMPGAAIVVKNEVIVGKGSNGSDYHKKYKCQRTVLACRSGEGYELCEGCHPKNHSEISVIKNAINNGNDTNGADLYLWGHWWCCPPCWQAMAKAGIQNVFLLKGSEILFNVDHPDNIIGRQFNLS